MSNPSKIPTRIPAAEVDISVGLVERLLTDQHPDLADRRLEVFAEGWDNVTVRCGDDLAVRLPRRRLGAEILSVELTWLPQLARHLPVRTPAALRTGQPGHGYPWHWAIVPFIEGRQASDDPVGPDQAAILGHFLRALHDASTPNEPPRNPYRGGPLGERADVTLERLDRLEATGRPVGVDFSRLRRRFMEAVAEPRDVDETWLHADFHPRNTIVMNGALAGVIDWGDMCVGDPCTDLAAVWMLLEPDHHDDVWSIYEPTESTLTRARGWTVAYGAMLFEAGGTGDSDLEQAGRDALVRVS